MRIVGGEFRGRALAAVGKGDVGAHLRPTPDRIRESLFNILTLGKFGDLVSGQRVLDCFAGTGALGLEALSRGAESVSFIENGRKSLSLLTKNIHICDATDRARVFKFSALNPPQNSNPPFDLVFMDPPYGKKMGQVALEMLLKNGWLAETATLILEDHAEQDLPPRFVKQDVRKFGGTVIHIVQLKTREEAE